MLSKTFAVCASGLLVSARKTLVAIVGFRAAAALLTSLATFATVEATAQQQRLLQVDDLFEIEGLARDFSGAERLSPDGQSAAFSWSRAYKTRSNYSYLAAGRGGDSDVWVQAKPGANAVNITQGAKDGTSWWGGVWSPDGQRLALLSTRGADGGLPRFGSGVVWIWHKGTDELRQISRRKVDRQSHSAGRNLIWLDNRRLLVPLEHAEPPSPWSHLPEAQRTLLDHWTRTLKGQEASANVLDSGNDWARPEQPRSQLMLVDTVNGTSRVIVDDAANSWRVAPGGKAVAYHRQIGAYAPTAEEKLRQDNRTKLFALRIVDLQGAALIEDDAALSDVTLDTLRWSVDGGEFAFAGRIKAGEAPRLFRGAIATGRIAPLRLDNLDISSPADDHDQKIEIRWTQAGEVLVRAKRTKATDPDMKDRYDWWLVSAAAPPRNLTQSLPEAPIALWPEDGSLSFVGFSAGAIWRVDATGQTQNLTASFKGRVDQLAWPKASGTAGLTYSKIVLAAREPRQPLDYSLLDLKSGVVKPLNKPDAEARLAGFNPAGDAAMFYATGREGTRMWRVTASSGQAKVLIEANSFLRDIAESEFRLIEYRSLKGQTLNGWILLPIDYQEGRRYPLLTWVYPGSMISAQADKPSSSHRIGSTSVFNMQLAAAQGFAVLLPSMPLEPYGGPDDPLLRLTEGVLPAVDEAIELGIADADRLFVSGHSFGGYATFGLVTQTSRFKAAIAHAGTTNLINTYGTLISWMRYAENANSILTMNIGWAEAGQGRMGSPPWKDRDRYIRNSPITYVDAVTTPLLIVHGDMDILGMEDPENFFRSLYRQGKRVRFARYVGEGHVLASPANIRDMWRRMIGWMDEYGDIKRNAQGEMVFENGRVATASGEGEDQPQ